MTGIALIDPTGIVIFNEINTMKTSLVLTLMLGSFLIQAQDNKKETSPGDPTITKKAEPLYIVDGVKVSDGNQKNIFLKIKPDEIESMCVVKGDSAIIRYGESGRDGVILVTTKSSKHKKRLIDRRGGLLNK